MVARQADSRQEKEPKHPHMGVSTAFFCHEINICNLPFAILYKAVSWHVPFLFNRSLQFFLNQ